MTQAVLLVAVLALSACSTPEEEAHAYVMANHYRFVEKVCESNGGVEQVKSYWCRGKGYTLNGRTRVTASCKNNVTTTVVLD